MLMKIPIDDEAMTFMTLGISTLSEPSRIPAPVTAASSTHSRKSITSSGTSPSHASHVTTT